MGGSASTVGPRLDVESLATLCIDPWRNDFVYVCLMSFTYGSMQNSMLSTPLPRVSRTINALDIIDDPALGRIPRRVLYLMVGLPHFLPVHLFQNFGDVRSHTTIWNLDQK